MSDGLSNDTNMECLTTSKLAVPITQATLYCVILCLAEQTSLLGIASKPWKFICIIVASVIDLGFNTIGSFVDSRTEPERSIQT